MTYGKHISNIAGLYVLWRKVPIADVRKAALKSRKFLFIFTLWTLLLDLEVAAATSTTTSMRPSRRTRSDHQFYGMQIPRPETVGLLDDEVDDSLHEQPGLDEDIEENGLGIKLQASKVQRAEVHRRYDEIVQKAKQPLDSQSRKFSGRDEHHVGDDYAKKMYVISVTREDQLVDNDKGESGGATITQLDQPVARQIESTATSSSAISKHISELVDRIKLQEADNVILQPAVEFLESNEGDRDVGQTKLEQQLWKKKPQAHPQRVENGTQADLDSGAHNPSKSDAHYHESAKRKQSAIVIDGDYESAIRSAASATAARKDRDAINQLSDDAGHKNKDFYDKARINADEVVMAEERDEEKKLIPDYNLGEPIKDWNRKRQEWARDHPEVKQEQLFILTGTQPWPCNNPEGDHLLLRCFKNKVDYSRIHGVGLFYNTALLDAHMPTFWAKLPVVRATMLAHPEVEWIWWLDADAIITDMEFSIPLHRYSAYNLVVHGWESLIFEKRSWLGLNAGSFLLRNCQWSLELLERWASMGPKAPMGDAYRHILSDFLPDRPRNPTDDQAALVLLLIKERQRWAGKLRVELDFFLSGYWLELMDGFEATEERYRAMEEQHAELWQLLERQGAVGKEKLMAAVGRAREHHLSTSGTIVQQRRAFITHFTGCQPCSGHHNNIYSSEQCRHGLLRALNYADDQVLRTLGYHHRALHLSDVLPSA